MATTQTTLAHELGVSYAEVIQDEPGVKSVWVRPVRDYFQIWVETEPIDDDAERRLFAATSVVTDRFPGIYVLYLLANPRFHVPGTAMVGGVIPQAAECVYRRDD
jgi:hypothetical protein